ncbi:hypothetical protein HanRHA438_Chr11g0523251 [Helianthus annuus]|nr:hypothetical protein HanRHA438_Chr11g0523251 [Helianthus annuus]
MRPNQTLLKRYTRLIRIPDRRDHPRIRDGDHHIAIHRRLSCQNFPKLPPRLIHRLPKNNRIRQRKVNVLENTRFRLRVWHQTRGLNTIFVYDQKLARFHFSLVSRLD